MSRKFLGHSGLYALASVAPILVNLAVTPFVTRLLGATDYGIVAVSISLFQFGIVVFTLGLAASITRQAIIATTGPGGAVATVLTGAGCAVLLFLLLLVLLPAWGPVLLPEGDTSILFNPLVSCLGLAFLQNAQSFFRAEQRVVTFVTLSAAASILAPLSGVALLIFVHATPDVYLAALAATHLTVGLVALIRCVGAARPKYSSGDFWTSLRIGLPTVPHQMATSFLALILVALTSHTSGLDGAGALQIGLLIGSAPLLLLGAFNNAWAPLIYRTEDDQRERVLAFTYRGYMLLTVGLVLGFAFMAPLVVPLVAGPLAEAMPVTQVALVTALGAPFMTSYLANIHLVFLSGRTTALAFTTPLAAAIAITCVALPIAVGWQIDIRLLALALPLFQIIQWLISIKLRRNRSTYMIPTVVVIPELLVIFTALAATYFMFQQLQIVIPGLLLLLVAVSCYRFSWVFSHFKRRRQGVS